MLIFLLGALRGIVEMLGYCLLGQAFLYLLAGPKRASNPIYQLLSLITRPPRHLCARLLPTGSSGLLVGIICFVILVLLWIGLAWARKFH
ncbi:MAG: hypothetical protein WAV95_03295 [Azonexus sp.]